MRNHFSIKTSAWINFRYPMWFMIDDKICSNINNLVFDNLKDQILELFDPITQSIDVHVYTCLINHAD